MTRRVQQLSVMEKAQILLWQTAPALLGGLVRPRPRMRHLLEKIGAGDRLVALHEELHRRHHGAPVWAMSPSGPVILILSPLDARRVLSDSDQTYSLDSAEKRAMLAGFQPDGVILARGAVRKTRRQFNETILGSSRPCPPEHERFTRVINQEIDGLLANVDELSWPMMETAFSRIGRRIVLGDAAADDVDITDVLLKLRSAANWLNRIPWQRTTTTTLRAELQDRIQRYVAAAEPGSLVSAFPASGAATDTAPAGQVPHWLMAMDLTAPIVTRALALLANHPTIATRVDEELVRVGGEAGSATPHLTATVLEAARLWPVVPFLGRVTTREVNWDGEVIPAETGILISAGYFSRGAHQGVAAHRFTPQWWMDGSARSNWGLLPFSRGSGSCPGELLGTFVATTACAAVLRRIRIVAGNPLWRDGASLPVTLNLSPIRFRTLTRTAIPH